MADLKSRLPENAPGKFYVDAQCIDCQLCQDLAPENFACNEEEEHHVVVCQPRNARELANVIDAMESCPVGSIGDDGEDAELAPSTSTADGAEGSETRTLEKGA